MSTSIDPSLTIDSTSNDGAWWIDEGVPGVGNRPEWLQEKFKSVADVAKSYNELEKRTMANSAPKEYDLSKGESWIDKEYAPFQEMLETARSKNVPQEVLDKMLDSVGTYLNEFNIDYDAERAQLGTNAEERLQTIDNWAKSNFSEDTYNALSNNLRTADAIKAMEEVRNKMNSNTTVIPNQGQEMGSNAPSLQDIQSELNRNLDKYKTDPVYRREIMNKIEMASKSSGYQDKQAY